MAYSEFKTRPSLTKVERWILEIADGLTFCDIGGIGVGARNERASIAHEAGADDIAMIDYRAKDFHEWKAFRARLKENGVPTVREIGGVNLEDRKFPARIGPWDVVHCTGILYHAPNPMQMLDNLFRITRRYLIVNTVTVPNLIENAAGRIVLEGAQMMFLPGLSAQQRAVLELWYQENLGWKPGQFSSYAPHVGDRAAVMPWRQISAASDAHYWGDRGDLSYSPYWTLFTPEAFRAAVELFGFRIRDEHSFKNHTTTLLCEAPA